MVQLGSHWTDFEVIWYLSFFRESVEKIQFSLKSDKNNEYFTWRRFHVYDDISVNSFRMRNILDRVLEKIKTHILRSIFFFHENRAVYEIMSKNMVETEATNDVTIWRIRVACWISKATSTRSRPCTYIHTCARIHTHTHRNMYKVFQIWPGLIVCKQVTVCPGHIWTTL
jgi:hypothetical protein